MNESSIPGQDKESAGLPCLYCGERYGPDDVRRHTEPVDCGPCITCVGKPACFECRLMYCVCDVHRYRG
ncbi:recombination activating protein 1 [Amycolatopsis acidicola]|uniref:Recombination activating protein 1 n=1 Tax=Amycolatopsis acidicola TaxID=2596893 RepID=A0A5N0VLK2_9PSEU|nr:recombination activating protein 1 [Amycolatopsis acidicola]KAA9166060.1 recombination activating protein 1 [Amycolatopsis acidicola]